ncbi:MAG: carboxypeptidase-like regulatory domain-containing protein [Bacteroidia bacterium]
MNKQQSQKVNMIDASVAVLNTPANKVIWNTNAVFTAAMASINSNMAALNSADSTRMASSVSFTATKEQTKANLIAATMLHAAAGKGYAASVNNTSLKTICSISESSLVKSADSNLGNMCMNIYNAVQPFIGSMAAWSVNATTLANLNTTITTFAGLVGTPVGQISVQNAAAMAIDAQIEIIYGILRDTIDTLMAQYKVNHATFYNAYFAAREVHHTGVHHSTTFEGFVYKIGGAALEHAQVVLSVAGNELRKHFTDASGHYKFTRLHLGSYTLTVSVAGYITQTKTITITTLQIVDTDFTLVASGGGGTNPTPTPTNGNL